MRKSFAVFCGARSGLNGSYTSAIVSLVQAIADKQGSVVYGGGRVGLMGELATASIVAGIPVIGVIPKMLSGLELAHPNLTELHVVANMHERKALMASRADAFIAAPGGFGTLDEIFEAITWSQLGIQTKPVGFLNIDGLFDPLREAIHSLSKAGFISEEHVNALIFEPDAKKLIEALIEVQVPLPRSEVRAK